LDIISTNVGLNPRQREWNAEIKENSAVPWQILSTAGTKYLSQTTARAKNR